jgi:hypothetical protein
MYFILCNFCLSVIGPLQVPHTNASTLSEKLKNVLSFSIC